MLKFVSVCGERAGGAEADLYHGDGGGKLETAYHLYLTPGEQFEKGEQVE